MMRRIFFLFRLTFSSDYFEIGAYISFLSFDIMFLKLIALLVAYWWFQDSLCDTNIPLFRPVAFFQSINPNPVKTSFLSMGEPKAKQLIQNPTSLWFEQRSYDNFSSHFAEYLLPSVPGKMSNSNVVLSLSNKDLPEKDQGSLESILLPVTFFECCSTEK